MSLTKSDLLAIDDLLTKRFEVELRPIRGDITEIRGDITEIRGDITEIRGDINDLNGKFSVLQTSVDKYLKRTEDWHAEFRVLDARVGRIQDVLVKKGVATEEELASIHK